MPRRGWIARWVTGCMRLAKIGIIQWGVHGGVIDWEGHSSESFAYLHLVCPFENQLNDCDAASSTSPTTPFWCSSNTTHRRSQQPVPPGTHLYTRYSRLSLSLASPPTRFSRNPTRNPTKTNCPSQTITPLRPDMAVVSKPLNPSCIRKTVPWRATMPRNDSSATPGLGRPLLRGGPWGGEREVGDVQEVSAGVVLVLRLGDESGGRWTIVWELQMMLWGL